MSNSKHTTDSVPSPPRDKENVYVPVDKNEPNPKATMEQEKAGDEHESRESHRFPKSGNNPTQQPTVCNVVQIFSSPGVHIGNVINYANGFQVPKENIKETEGMATLRKSKKPVIDKDIDIVKDHIGLGYKDTFLKLGFTECEIQQSEYRFNKDMNGLIRFLLMDWRQTNGKAGTVGVLANALWDSNQREALKKWSLKYDNLHNER